MNFLKLVFAMMFCASIAMSNTITHQQLQEKTEEVVSLLTAAYDCREDQLTLGDEEIIAAPNDKHIYKLLEWSVNYFTFTQKIMCQSKGQAYYRAGFYAAGTCLLFCLFSGDYQAALGAPFLYGTLGGWCVKKLIKSSEDEERLTKLLEIDLKLPKQFEDLSVNEGFKKLIESLLHVYNCAKSDFKTCSECRTKDYSRAQQRISCSMHERIFGF